MPSFLGETVARPLMWKIQQSLYIKTAGLSCARCSRSLKISQQVIIKKEKEDVCGDAGHIAFIVNAIDNYRWTQKTIL